jgi:hypothetical protein
MDEATNAHLAPSTIWLLAALQLTGCAAGSSQPMRPTERTNCQHHDPDADARLGITPPELARPRCSPLQLRSAQEVDELDDDYFEGAHYGQRVLVRGRSILGGVCCRFCWPCVAAIALGSGPGTDATPGTGRMVFLTAAELASRGQAFEDAQWSGFTQMCGWSKGRYCCRSPLLGRDVVVTGTIIATPEVKPGRDPEHNCSGSFPILPPSPLPRCEFSVPWRSEIDEVAAMAVESVCEVRDTASN